MPSEPGPAEGVQQNPAKNASGGSGARTSRMFRGMTASIPGFGGFRGGTAAFAMNLGPFGMPEETMTSSMLVGMPQHNTSCMDRFVMTHSNPFRKGWELLLAIVLIYVATVLPFKIVFLEGAISGECHGPAGDRVCTAQPEAVSFYWWERMDEWFMEPFFIIDVAVNFFFSFNDSNGKEVVHFWPASKRYFSKHFWIDIVACIPSALMRLIVNAIAGVDSDETNDSSGQNLAKIGKLRVVQRATKITKLVRLARILKIVAFLNQNETWMRLKDLRSVRLLNFLFGLIWAVHIFACAWYYVATCHDNHVNTWLGQRELYNGLYLIEVRQPALAWLHSMYFVMTTFTTVGFGDMSAKTVGEIMFVMLLMIAGIFVNSIILSSAIDIWNSVDESAQAIDDQKKVVDGFGEHTHLQQKRIVELKESVGQTSIGTNYDRMKMKSLLTSSALPREVVTKLPQEVFNGELEKNIFVTCCKASYRHLPPRFSLLVALWCNLRIYSRSEIVYYCHDHAWNVFLVYDGVFAALAIASSDGGQSAITPAGLNAVEALNRPSRHVKKELREQAAALATNISGKSKSDLKMVATPSMVERGEATTLSPYRLFCRGNYFGDAEVLLEPGPRRACHRCESKKGSLLVLSKHDILDLLQEFPPCADAWKISSRRREIHDSHMLKRLTWAPMSRPADEHRVNGWFPYEDFAASMIAKEWRVRRKPKEIRVWGLTDAQRQIVESRKAVKCSTCGPGYVHDLAASVESLRSEVTDMQGRMRKELSDLHEAMRELRQDVARMPDHSSPVPIRTLFLDQGELI